MPEMEVYAVLVFVTLQRLAELVIARSNTKGLLERGGVEHAPGHYPFMVILHASWLLGLWWFAQGQSIQPVWLILFFAMQAGRVWVLATLGRRWTTRIITVPGERLVSKGPYRFVSHPNYLIVVVEIATLPMAFGLYLFAAVFSLLNALILIVRIRAENSALHPSGSLSN
jgi:methyltransferase